MPDTIDRTHLVEDNLRLAYYWANRIGRGCSRVNRDDLVSAGLLALVRAARTYNPNRGPFTPFASRCIRQEVARERWTALSGYSHATLMRLRRLGCVELPRVGPLVEGCDPAAPAEQETVDMERAEWIAAAVARLPPTESALVLNHFWAGLTQTQIAERWGVTPAAIRQRLERILAKLRQVLEAA